MNARDWLSIEDELNIIRADVNAAQKVSYRSAGARVETTLIMLIRLVADAAAHRALEELRAQ